MTPRCLNHTPAGTRWPPYNTLMVPGGHQRLSRNRDFSVNASHASLKQQRPHQWGPKRGPILENWTWHLGPSLLVRGSILKKKVGWDLSQNGCTVTAIGQPSLTPKGPLGSSQVTPKSQFSANPCRLENSYFLTGGDRAGGAWKVGHNIRDLAIG